MAFLGIFPKAAVEKEKGIHKDLERLAPILASIREAVIIAEPDGTVILANPASEFITGYLPQDLVGRKIREVLSFQCRGADASRFFTEALAGWQAVELPAGCSLLQPRGKSVPVTATVTPLYSPQGDYAGIILVLRDLSEDVKRKRRQYEFLSFVSHQFRQPLGTLRWGLELVLDGAPNLEPQHRELLSDLHAVTVRFKDFVNDLVEISRLEEGRVELKLETVDLRQVIEAVWQELKAVAESHNVSAELFPGIPPGSTLPISGDKNRLHDIFTNLLSNAILYNRPRGTVKLEARQVSWMSAKELASSRPRAMETSEYLEQFDSRTSPEPQFLLVTVADTGLGIPKEQHTHVFESFFRGNNVVRTGLEGTGLGLAIAKALVERMSGTIFFTSEENVGTTFYLLFPLFKKQP